RPPALFRRRSFQLPRQGASGRERRDGGGVRAVRPTVAEPVARRPFASGAPSREGVMTDYAAYARRNMVNPFDPAADPDRHYLWQRLVEADCEAFIAGDWAAVERDF